MSMNLPPPPPGSDPNQAWVPPPPPPEGGQSWVPPPPPGPDPSFRVTGNDAPPPEYGSPVVSSSSSALKPLLVVVGVLVVLGILAGIAFAVLSSGDDGDDATSQATLPPVASSALEALEEITVPTIPEITIPEITLPPGVTLPADVTLPQATVSPEVTTAPTAPPTAAPTAAPTAPPEAVDLFSGTQARGVVADIATARGADPLRILTIAFYPTYAFAEVQDPGTPEYVDRYGWRDRQVSAPEPVRLFGDGDLESNLFSAPDVNWDAIPAATVTALEQAAIPEGEVTHVIVERDLPFKPDVVMRVYVNSPRASAYVEFDSQGNFLEVVS